jgi:hypothetical protein
MPNDLVFASALEPGEWIALRSGTYRVDDVATVHGKTHIGTQHGVLVLSADSPVLLVGRDGLAEHPEGTFDVQVRGDQ